MSAFTATVIRWLGRELRSLFRGLLVGTVLVTVWFLTDLTLRKQADYWLVFICGTCGALMAQAQQKGGKHEHHQDTVAR